MGASGGALLRVAAVVAQGTRMGVRAYPGRRHAKQGTGAHCIEDARASRVTTRMKNRVRKVDDDDANLGAQSRSTDNKTST